MNDRVLRHLVVFLVVLLVDPILRTTEAGEAQWIWPQGPRTSGATFEIEKPFVHSALSGRATLRVATDFCSAVVLLNGVRVARAGRTDPDVLVDVTRQVVRDENRLEARVRSTGGPAALAVELVVTAADGSEERIVSDGAWRVRDENAGGAAGAGVEVHGLVGVEPWWTIERRPAISAFDEYNQFKEAKAGDKDSARFQLPPGFRLDVVHRAREGEGSWVSLEVDPRGRYLIGKEERGILRLTASDGECRVELINDSVRGVQGLLWADDFLYAYANRSQVFYRLRHLEAEDSLDDARLLMAVPGKSQGDHGRHQVVIGPDRKLYAIHGDGVPVPEVAQSLIPRIREFGVSGRPLTGHVIRTNHEGRPWEVFASGIRNAYGLAFNPDGELFTYDADSEASNGIPWYRPTRILHIVQGADYGWRSGREVWPGYSPESLPAVVPVGKGSPTALQFGTGSNFPPHLRRALFALDWTYGRILAVHLVPQGASYVGHAEVFLRGRPLNVVDLDFDTDGSMLFVTGGRSTQSTLYRLRHVGDSTAEPEETRQQAARRVYSDDMRRLRKRLETLHGKGADKGDETAIETAWRHLDHDDPWIRHAARIVIERQPTSLWQKKALTEPAPQRALPALLGLARVAPASGDDRIWRRLREIAFVELSHEYQSIGVRVVQLLAAERTPGPEAWAPVLARFEPLFPSGVRGLDRELCSLLAQGGSREVAGKTLGLLAQSPPQVDALHYLLCLARVRDGWSEARRDAYFRLVRGARLFKGDRRLPGVLRELEETALASVPEGEREKFERLLADSPSSAATSTPAPESGAKARAFVRQWTLADLEDTAGGRGDAGDLERGKRLFDEALCGHCHRLASVGNAFGPDLTAVGARLGRRDLLEAILAPSKVVATNHESYVISTRDGEVITGRVVWDDFRKSTLHIGTDPMRLDVIRQIPKSDIVSYVVSDVSPMPAGLLDTLQREEILDLLAYIESGGE